MSAKMNQKEAVFQAVTNTCEPSDSGAFLPTKEQRAAVNLILFEGFRNGDISIDREFNDKDLKSYVSGLQSNWLRKDTRLNGDVKYVAKNPGSRAGSGNPQVKAMRALQSTMTDPTKVAEIQSYIDAAIAAAKPTKTVTINVADLPAELQHLVSGS